MRGNASTPKELLKRPDRHLRKFAGLSKREQAFIEKMDSQLSAQPVRIESRYMPNLSRDVQMHHGIHRYTPWFLFTGQERIIPAHTRQLHSGRDIRVGP